MFKTPLFAICFAFVGASAGMAGSLGDPVTSEPVLPVEVPAQTAEEWSGFYLGGQLATGDGFDGAADFDTTGYGVHAGYLYDLGGFVVGGELDYDALQLDTGGVETDGRTARLKAVAGYDLGSFMPYVAAGIADVEIETVGGDLRDQISFFGLGGSYQINERFRLGAEYLVHQGDDFDGSGTDFELDTLSLRGSFSF